MSKKLFEVKKGDYYFSTEYSMITQSFSETDKSLITKVEDHGDVVWVEFEEDNSWELDKATVGSSVSLGLENSIVFIGTDQAAIDAGIDAYIKGSAVEIQFKKSTLKS